MENRAKTIVAPCPLPCLLGVRKAPSGAFTPANLKRENIWSYSFWKLIGGIAKMPCLTKSAHHRTFLFCMLRFIIISFAFLSLPCAAFPSLERDLEDIGPNNVDWNGYYTTSDGEKIYCPEAFREKRKQYAIKKQRERTTNWIMTFAIILPSCAIGYVIYKEKKEKVRRKAEEEPCLKQLKEEQERQKKKAERLENLRKERETTSQTIGLLLRTPENDIIGQLKQTCQTSLNHINQYIEEKQTEQGLAYEQYIGYLLEKEGHIIFYRGATSSLQDKGVDLIAIKNNHVRLIQCKCFNEDIQNHQIQKYLGHIAFDWKFAQNAPIHGFSHTWELYYTPWLSKAAYQACRDNHIQLTKQSAGIAPLVKAFHFEGEKRYMQSGQQFYDHIISYIDGQHYRRFYNPEEAEAAGFSPLQLIDNNTVNLINQQTVTAYAQTHPQTPLETLTCPWLDF